MTNRGEELAERFVALMGELGGVGPALERLEAEAQAAGVAHTVQRLRPTPDDFLILKFVREIAPSVQAVIVEHLQQHLHGATVLIIDADITAWLERGGHA